MLSLLNAQHLSVYAVSCTVGLIKGMIWKILCNNLYIWLCVIWIKIFKYSCNNPINSLIILTVSCLRTSIVPQPSLDLGHLTCKLRISRLAKLSGNNCSLITDVLSTGHLASPDSLKQKMIFYSKCECYGG
jgi:hypothetical protein